MVISGIGTLMPWNMFITATAVSTVTVPGSQSQLTVKNSAILKQQLGGDENVTCQKSVLFSVLYQLQAGR